MILLILFALVALGSLGRLAQLVATDGLGDRPGPRSHDHQYVAPWRA